MNYKLVTCFAANCPLHTANFKISATLRMHQKGAKGMRQPKLHKWADKFTEILIYFMVLFSPWAFGTTSTGPSGP